MANDRPDGKRVDQPTGTEFVVDGGTVQGVPHK